MANKTLLEIVQIVGRCISSDEIDELDETTEASDILAFVKMAFEDVIDRREWEFTKHQVRALDAREAGDTQINRLIIPLEIMQLSGLFVRYRTPVDGRTHIFKELCYLSPHEFLVHVQQGNENDSNITTILNDDGVPMLIRNDIPPTYYTSFDEYHIWFDAYDSSLGTGNRAGDAVILGNFFPLVNWGSGSATLPVPERVERLIVNEAISIAAVRLRQTADPIANRNAQRIFNRLRESEPRVYKDTDEINYGRRKR